MSSAAFYGLLLGVFALAAAVRVYPRIVLPNVFFSDTMFHLFYARELKANGHRIPKFLTRCLQTNLNVYPYGYHWLLSWLPTPAMHVFERINGAVFDCASAAIAALFLRRIGWSHGATFHVIALFLFSPLLLRLGSGPRAYNGSPRVFGQTLYLFHLLAFVMYQNQQSYAWLSACIVLLSLIPISSKFSMQTAILFGLPLMLAFPLYELVFLGSFALSLVWGGGRALAVIRGTLAHSQNYIQKQKTYLYPHYRTLWRVVSDYREHLQSVRAGKMRPRELLDAMLADGHWVFIVVLAVPVFPLALYQSMADSGGGNVEAVFGIVAWTAFVLFLVTKHKPFLFLGEGERYLEHAIIPILFFFVSYAAGREIVAYGVEILFVLFAVYFARTYTGRYRGLNRASLRRGPLMEVINRLEDGMVMPIPNYHGKAILFWTERTKVLTPYLIFDERYFDRELYEFIFGKNFEYPSGRLASIVARFNVKYILSTPDEMEKYKREFLDKEIDFGAIAELCATDSEHYLYKVKGI